MADIIWTGNGDGTSWNDPLNWSPGTIPGASDNVFIGTVPEGTSGIVTLDENVTVARLDLGIGGGIIGSGNLTVTSVMNWIGGTQGGTGVTIIAEGARLNIAGDFDNTLDGRTLNNNGTITWTGSGDIRAQFGASIDNAGIFDIQNDSSLINRFGDASTVINTGTLIKSAGSQITDLGSNVIFDNQGTIEVQTGTLSFSDSTTSSGNFNVAENGTLEFNGGTHGISGPDASFGGAGIYRVTFGTTVTIDTPVTIGNLETSGIVNINDRIAVLNLDQTEGSFNGDGNLIIADRFNWNGGIQSGRGTTTIAPGAALNISTSGGKNLTERTLNNNGIVTWRDDGVIQIENGASINNAGSFEIQNDSFLFGGFGSLGEATFFNNTGTLLKSAGEGLTILSDNVFRSSGRIEVERGTLELNGGELIDATGEIVEPGGSFNLSNTTVTEISELPDLVVTDVTVPPSLNLGDPIEVNWTVTNQGNNSSLTAQWQDAIYLSSDEQFDIATDIFLGAVSIDDVQTPLAPGESYTITEAVTIPSTAADGQFLLFVTDENNDELETSKSNNVFAEAVQFPTGLIVNLDVDNNGQTDALTDGSLIMRYLFGFRDDTLIDGAIGPDADRTTASEIINYLDAVSPIMLDVDSNGTVDALTDGVMIIRYLFQFTGETLINGAIGPNADRSTASEIEAFLQSFDLGSDTQTIISGDFVGQFRGLMGLI